MGKLVHLRLTDKLYSEIQKTVKEFGFQSTADFIRESARKYLEEYETKKAIKRLKSLQGSVKGKIKRLSKKELDDIAHEWVKHNPSDVFREYGVY